MTSWLKKCYVTDLQKNWVPWLRRGLWGELKDGLWREHRRELEFKRILKLEEPCPVDICFRDKFFLNLNSGSLIK